MNKLNIPENREAFAALPNTVQVDVLEKVGWIIRITKAPIFAQAGEMDTAVRHLGVSPATVRRWITAYRRDGWRALVDERKAPKPSRLPEAFRHWVCLIFLNTRTTSARGVQRLMLDRLERWQRTGDPQHAIPGYPSPPPVMSKTGVPAGWSLDSIDRLRPGTVPQMLMTRRAKAARQPIATRTNHGAPIAL